MAWKMTWGRERKEREREREREREIDRERDRERETKRDRKRDEMKEEELIRFQKKRNTITIKDPVIYWFRNEPKGMKKNLELE